MAISIKQFESVSAEIAAKPFARKRFTKNLTGFRYLQYRLLRPLLKQRYKRFQEQHMDWPWIAPDTIKALNKLLTKEMRGFEYGSGRSTLFYAQRIGAITSIEHYEGWYGKVKDMLIEGKADNAEVVLVKPDPAFVLPKLSSLQQLQMSAEQYPAKDELFEAYCNAIDRFEDNSLDFVVVDGRARVRCTQKTIPKLKSGGLLMLDNSERARYAEVHAWLKDWPKLVASTGLTDTTLWLKP